MAGISRNERWILMLTAAFLLVAGFWFFTQRGAVQPYEVTHGADASVQEQDGRPDSLLEDEVIDLNTADLYDLGRLPGIGEKRAQAIVGYRETYGPFERVEDLTLVDGIGSGILAEVAPYVTVSGRNA